MTVSLPLKIGTRGSPLALAQAREVRDRLASAHNELAEDGAIETHVIKTSGDKFTDRPLADIGGKGLFTTEIEEALNTGAIDMAVHSMKDVPTWLPDGLQIACILPREDARDALIGDGLTGIKALPQGARVGTASLRRRAQLLHLRPDLEITMLRGNVATRLRKVAEGEFDATLLAVAGLKRLDCAEHIAAAIPPEEMLPAVAQGAIGIECRADDGRGRDRLEALNHKESALCVAAERALLAALDGSCRTPIAALAEMRSNGRLYLRALIARPDGSMVHRAERQGAAADGVAMGRDAGAELRAAGGPDFFDD
ncbi:MAG: hydroxymethylbilane synthase [Alphaproteobacteria bacterium]|nr:hydroxymethylbilane synthase [Alphaproteobacteria bacterium]